MSSPLKLLLIDDNPDDRALVIRTLSREFPDIQIEQITEANGFAQALERGEFDLACTDYQLKWTDGLAVLRAVKARFPDRPVIMLTGTGSEEIAVEAMKNGLDDYILKSSKHFIRLPAAVRSALERAESCVKRRQAEAALAEREYLLRTIIETEPECVKMLAPDCTLLSMNAAGLAMIEADRAEQVLGKSICPLVAPESRDAFVNLIRRVGRGEGGRLEFEIVGLKGSRRWLETHAVPLRQQDGSTVVLGIARDITERKRADEVAAQSRRKYEELVNTVNGIVWEVDVRTMTFTFVSRRAEEMLGYPWEQWLTVPNFWLDHIHPEDREWALAFCLEETRKKSGHTFEYRMLAADGRTVWLRDIVSVIVEDDQPVMLRGVMVDITERKRAEEALAESETRLRMATQASSVGLWDWDLHTNAVFFSPEWKSQIGYGDDELTGRYEEWESRLHPDDRDRVLAYLRAYLARPKGPYEVEFRLRHKDGSYRWIYARGEILRDALGDATRMLGCHIDITERKQAEAQRDDLARRLLSAQESERRRIARDLHDEIGQALSALKFNLSRAQRTSGEPERVKLLSDCLDITDQVLRQTRELALELRPSVLDDLGLGCAIEWYVDRQTAQTGLKVEHCIEAELPPLGSDVQIACFRILQEAMTNSVRHSRGGRITVFLRKVDAGVELRVADDGAGFDVAEAMAGAALGKSMGLLSMRERAELLGGEFCINSAPDQGTEIRVTFPLRDSSALPRATGGKASR